MIPGVQRLLQKELRDQWNNFSLRRKVWIQKHRPEVEWLRKETK